MVKDADFIAVIPLFLLAALAAFPQNASAGGFVLPAGKETFATIGFRLQVNAGAAEGLAGAVNGDPSRGGTHYDFSIRRAQIAVAGQIVPAFGFNLTLEHNNLGKNRSAGSGFLPLDAYIDWGLSESTRVVVGAFPPPFSRNRLTQPFSLIGLDRPLMEEIMPDVAPFLDKRDRGMMLMGNYGGFQYRYAVTSGAVPQETGAETLRTTWRIQMAFADPEDGVFMKEAYLGEKQVFTIGYGSDAQEKISVGPGGAPANYTGVTYDIALEGGKGVNLIFAHYRYGWGNAERTGSNGLFAQGSGWNLTAAFINPESIDPAKGMAGIFQPYLRHTSWDAESSSPSAKQTRTAAGFAYYLKGHDAKIVLEYERTNFAREGSSNDMKGHASYTMQWQAAF